MTPREIREINKVFCSLHDQPAVRLARGAAERIRWMLALEAGEEVSSYRLTFLEQEVVRMAHHMVEVCQRFNDRFPHDQMSVQDILDILEAATARFEET